MYLRFAKSRKILAVFLFIVLVFFYSLSVYVFFSSSRTLEAKVFHYPSITKDGTYVAEVHNIPMKNDFAGDLSRYSDIELFVEELFLGPQSIYLENSLLNSVSLDNLIYSLVGERKLLFLFLKSEKKIESVLMQDLTEWIRVNINNYYADVDFFLFINNNYTEKNLQS